MPAVEIRPGIHWIGVNDRTTDLFEGLWPITQEGVSYNSYLVSGEKTAIIDLAKSIKVDEFFSQVEEVSDLSKIDYLIVNHLEPDHAGLLTTFRRLAPGATILGSAKAVELLGKFYDITENVRAVSDGETLSLGGKELKFFSTPFVHWPETIMTYETGARVLFSCDGFGGYGAISGALFDDECANHDFHEGEALRYFANIVSSFSARVLAAIEKLSGLPVEVVAPSHGLIWRKDPGRIISLYKKWAGYAGGTAETGITLVYGSMYGNTERMVNAVSRGISSVGVPLQIFDAARTHPSYILSSLWENSGVVVGAPTYEVRLFPPVAQVLHAAALKHVVNKKAAYFGSFGWSGGALPEMKKLVEPLKWDVTEAFEFNGCPRPEDLRKGEELGRRFADLIKRSG